MSHTQTEMSKKVARGKCHACGFYVKLDGHNDRCRPVDEKKKYKMRALAWMGDALHTADVRMHLLRVVNNVTELERQSELYKSGDAQAEYYRKYGDMSYARGDTVNLLSEAFEASYHGPFRMAYLWRTFPTYAAGELTSVADEVFSGEALLDVDSLELDTSPSASSVEEVNAAMEEAKLVDSSDSDLVGPKCYRCSKAFRSRDSLDRHITRNRCFRVRRGSHGLSRIPSS